jgi:hypothetical protein
MSKPETTIGFGHRASILWFKMHEARDNRSEQLRILRDELDKVEQQGREVALAELREIG